MKISKIDRQAIKKIVTKNDNKRKRSDTPEVLHLLVTIKL